MSENAIAALLGAVVGGLATMLGSVFVARWESTRVYRIRIYDELLPSLSLLAGDLENAEISVMEPIVRAGHIASRRDRRRVDALHWKFLSARIAYSRVPMKQISPPEGIGMPRGSGEQEKDWESPEAEEYGKVATEFLSAITGYQDWLKAKLS